VTTVEIIDRIRDWLNDNVCSQIKLKRPYDDDVTKFELVHPVAYSIFYPAQKANNEIGIPSISVMFDEATDDGKIYTLPIKLVFCVYSPGFHKPEDDFTPDNEGWRDLLNFMDRTKAAIIRSRNLNGVSAQLPLTLGLTIPEEQTPELDPYYFGYITFDVNASSYPQSEISKML